MQLIVQLCTYHGSKGREFEYVYMPTLETYKWESARYNKSGIPLDISEYKTEDEIKNEIKPSDLTKLMYVAMTRAKHTLRMSYPEMVNKKTRKPTKYIVAIQDMLQKENEPFKYDENSYWEQTKNLLIKADYDYKTDFRELITTRLGNRAYSPSSINRYLAWYKYFYEKKTGNKVSLTKFIYTEDEMKEAVEKFKQAVSAIKNFEFEPSYKDNACQYCSYKDYCGMNRI